MHALGRRPSACRGRCWSGFVRAEMSAMRARCAAVLQTWLGTFATNVQDQACSMLKYRSWEPGRIREPQMWEAGMQECEQMVEIHNRMHRIRSTWVINENI